MDWHRAWRAHGHRHWVIAKATPVTTGSISYSGLKDRSTLQGLLELSRPIWRSMPLNLPALPQAFASSDIAGGSLPFHQIVHLNDGSYSNSRSWIGGFGGENNININVTGVGPVSAGYAGIDLKAHRPNHFVRIRQRQRQLPVGPDRSERSPSNTAEIPTKIPLVADTGTYHDRTGGTYYVQYTTSATPAFGSRCQLGNARLRFTGGWHQRRVSASLQSDIASERHRSCESSFRAEIGSMKLKSMAAPVPEPASLSLAGYWSRSAFSPAAVANRDVSVIATSSYSMNVTAAGSQAAVTSLTVEAVCVNVTAGC